VLIHIEIRLLASIVDSKPPAWRKAQMCVREADYQYEFIPSATFMRSIPRDCRFLRVALNLSCSWAMAASSDDVVEDGNAPSICRSKSYELRRSAGGAGRVTDERHEAASRRRGSSTVSPTYQIRLCSMSRRILSNPPGWAWYWTVRPKPRWIEELGAKRSR